MNLQTHYDLVEARAATKMKPRRAGSRAGVIARTRVSGRGRTIADVATAVSVGYERRKVSEIVSILRERGVSVLLDVRAVAFSHRPEYRKVALQRALAAAGIEYVHLAVAGNPYRDQKGDIERCLASYRKHLVRNPGIREAVADAIREAAAVGVLCYEREHDHCHRSVLLELITRAWSTLDVHVVDD
jgi:uncharacterized protein (DUF488 family)